MIEKKCETCEKIMLLRVVNKKGSKNYGKVLVSDKNKRFCSIECQNIWQNKISWEDRVGVNTANRIRNETSERVKGDKNPTSDPKIAKKVSESLKKYLKENPEERIGEKNAFYGKKHTDEYKKWATESRKGIDQCTPEQRIKQYENQPRGEDCHLWQGGKSFEIYPKEFNKHLKKKIKIRDNHTCIICNKKTQKLDIHHIDYDKMNSSEKNLIALCHSCHSKTNANRQQWEFFFVSIITEKYDNLA